jgi:hypothetical protein
MNNKLIKIANLINNLNSSVNLINGHQKFHPFFSSFLLAMSGGGSSGNAEGDMHSSRLKALFNGRVLNEVKTCPAG